MPQAELTGVDGVNHLWVGERSVQPVLDEVAPTVPEQPVELPGTWSGPQARGA